MTKPPEAGERPKGAYGLRLEGLAEAASLLADADPAWPVLAVEAVAGPAVAGPESLREDAATLRLRTGGQIALDRRRGRAVITTPRRLQPVEIVHPYLAPVAAVMAYWLGRESFHGGAFAIGDAAWGIVADRSAGKSTLLARLALDGVTVVADDQLVVEDGRCFAGPRSVDLRRSAAERLGGTDELGVVGARERWRLRLGHAPPQLALAGWIHLDWGPTLELEPVRGAQRMELLGRHRGVNVPPRQPTVLLELAALPAFVLRRPKSWEALPSSADLLGQLAHG